MTGLRHLQVLEHLLELLEQLLGGLLVAGARQPLHPLDHVVEILLAHYPGVGVERPSQLLRIVAQLFGELAHEFVERSPQVLGQLLDLFIAGAAFQRLLQRVLRRAQCFVDIGDVAVLDHHGERPQAGDNFAQRRVIPGGIQLPRDAVETEILAGLGCKQFGRDHQGVQRGIDVPVLIGIERQNPALLDQRPRQRLGEQPFRKPHVKRFTAALIAGLVLGRQRQRDVGAGIGILAEILYSLADAITGTRIWKHQRKLRRVEQRSGF